MKIVKKMFEIFMTYIHTLGQKILGFRLNTGQTIRKNWIRIRQKKCLDPDSETRDNAFKIRLHVGYMTFSFRTDIPNRRLKDFETIKRIFEQDIFFSTNEYILYTNIQGE